MGLGVLGKGIPRVSVLVFWGKGIPWVCVFWVKGYYGFRQKSFGKETTSFRRSFGEGKALFRLFSITQPTFKTKLIMVNF